LPLHTRRRVIEAVLNEILGLHNKPKAALHSACELMSPKKKKKWQKKCKADIKAGPVWDTDGSKTNRTGNGGVKMGLKKGTQLQPGSPHHSIPG